jgi:hypothetical protein
MKFLQYQHSHIKNEQSFQRWCMKYNIEYLFSDTLENVNVFNPDFIWSPSDWFEPSRFPNAKIMYGPSLFVFPSQGHGCVGQPLSTENAYINCLSKWVGESYREFVSSTKVPYVHLPFSVDTDRFTPISSDKIYDFLIYSKHRDSTDVQKVIETVNKLNVSYNVITYGSYNESQYIDLLNKSKFCIWIGCHESQGFALQECLSMNVPIFVWNVKTMKEEYSSHGSKIYEHYSQNLYATSIPYWDTRCGAVLTNPTMIEDELLEFMKGSYSPREFVLETLSDDVCFKRLLITYDLKNT